jgi:triacylglycerol esterase/lipase EstA (alpha/beta hydrolase family)
MAVPLRMCALIVALALTAAAPASAQEPLPPQGPSPPGANDFTCKPPPRHPYPVVLVHGTFLNMRSPWNAVAPALARLGYCVFALDYGNNATGDIQTSARQLRTFVDRVLSATGATKVSMVGHSQGGMMPRYLIRFLGATNQVDDLVGFSPSNHGTTNALAGPAAQTGCVACGQQVTGSDFLRELNTGDETPGSASYTVVQTRDDEVVTPFGSAFLAPGPAVTNVLIQDRCPADSTDHIGMPYDPVAIQWMLAALGRPGPAPADFVPDCTGQAVATFPDSDSAGPAEPPRPATRLALGAHFRIAGRRVRAGLFARHGTVRDVVVSLRTTRGEVLGRTRPVTVTGARRVAIVRLRRAPKPGTYLLRATWRNADGQTLAVIRRLRIVRG